LSRRENEHSGVQGVLTLNYDCYENEQKREETTHASQLSAGDRNTVELVEYNQEKGLMDNLNEVKHSERYRITAERLVSLIKEHGERVN
jgi:hypothetical protein